MVVGRWPGEEKEAGEYVMSISVPQRGTMAYCHSCLGTKELENLCPGIGSMTYG